MSTCTFNLSHKVAVSAIQKRVKTTLEKDMNWDFYTKGAQDR